MNRKQDQTIFCLQDTHVRSKDTHINERVERIFHENRNIKRTGVVILTLDKIDFKIKMVKKQGRTLYNYKRVSSLGEYNDYKCTCT